MSKQKTKPTDVKVSFAISKYRHITFGQKKGYVSCAEFIDSPVFNEFKLNKVEDIPLPSTKVYKDKVPIKKAKIEDVRKIGQYIPQDQAFYEEILSWPTLEGNAEDGAEHDD